MKNKCETEGDLDLFLNGPNFTRNGVITPMLLIKAIFLQVNSLEGISFSSRSMKIKALVKVLILTTQIFLPLVLQNNYSLNLTTLDAYNFGLTKAKNPGPKNMEYLSI